MSRKPARSTQVDALRSEVRDLRALLAAVLDALTLDYGVDSYDERIKERAGIAKVALRDGLDETDRIGWNADWLSRQLRKDESRHRAGESGD